MPGRNKQKAESTFHISGAKYPQTQPKAGSWLRAELVIAMMRCEPGEPQKTCKVVLLEGLHPRHLQPHVSSLSRPRGQQDEESKHSGCPFPTWAGLSLLLTFSRPS